MRGVGPIVLAGILLAQAAWADGQIREWTAFRQDDGLGHNAVSAGLEAADGSIWFATFGGGVSRYDGRLWETFAAADGLRGNVVLDIQESSDGSLWVVSAPDKDPSGPGSVARYKEGKWSVLQIPDSVAGDSGAQQVQELGEGRICVVTGQGKMVHRDGVDWHVVDRPDGRPLRGVRCLHQSAEGLLWVAYEGRPQRGGDPGARQGNPRGNVRRGNRGPRRLGLGILRTNRGGDRLGVIDPATGLWQEFRGAQGLAEAVVLSMDQDAEGGLWFGTQSGGIAWYQDEKWRWFGADDGLPNARVEVVRAMPDGSIWAGTPAGVARYAPESDTWQSFTERDGLPSNFVTAIWPALDGSVWVGTRGGAARYAFTGWVHHNRWPGLKDRGRVALASDAAGRIWVGTGEGFYYLEDDQWHPVHSVRVGRARIVGLERDGLGTLWGATAGGVYRNRDRQWEVHRPAEGVQIPILDMAPAAGGGVWVSTRTGVYGFDGSAWSVFATDVPGPITAVWEARDGAVWIGVEDGVVRISTKGQRHYTVAEGLPEGQVMELAEAHGQVWVSTALGGVARFDGTNWIRVPDQTDAQFNGVSRISSSADGTVWLASAIDGAIRTDGSVWVRYTVREGLPGSRVYDVHRDDLGQLWFATDGGLACYTPDQEAPSTTLLMPPREVAPHQGVFLEFTGQDAWKQTPAWSLQYTWRLDRGSWTPFSVKDRVFFENPEPGTHQFEVRAMDLAFNVEDTPVVHRFIVLAPVWLRPWFLVSALVALTAVGVSTFLAVQRNRRWKAAQTRLIVELEAELQEAHDMQMGLLPPRPLEAESYEMAGRCVAANHVGGDYYQYFWLDRERRRLGFSAADVSGKAMKAAVRAVQLSQILRYEFQGERPPVEILGDLDRVLRDQLDANSFVTCCLGVLDAHDGCVSLGNAAHPFPYHYSASTGELRAIELPSLPLGLTLPPGIPRDHGEATLDMQPGDVLVLYSDGVTDMQNEHGDFYEEGRLASLIRQHADQEPEALIDTILRDLFRFKGDAAQTDDVTLLVLRSLPVS